MLNKPHLIHTLIDRTQVLLAAATVILSPAKFAAGLKNALNSSIPEGYEDDAGFHFGSEPSREEKN
jgi:hypothetical protein